MKAKIFGRLKQEYSALGLGDEILMSRAESLAALGLVTDDNIDAVVAAQRSDLENLQKANDKRVADALTTAKKKAEEEAQKKAEAEKTAEEEATKKEEVKPEGDDRIASLEATVRKLMEGHKKEAEENRKLIENLTSSKTDLEKQVKTLSDENEAAKAKAATEAFHAKVKAKAKELGVPDWRIDEGFTLAQDASDETIAETLGKVANNISAQLLPGGGNRFPLGNDKPSTDEIKSLAATLIP